MKWLVSVELPTASGIGAQKEGQPEPLSYLVADSNGLAATGAAKGAGALFVVECA